VQKLKNKKLSRGLKKGELIKAGKTDHSWWRKKKKKRGTFTNAGETKGKSAARRGGVGRSVTTF